MTSVLYFNKVKGCLLLECLIVIFENKTSDGSISDLVILTPPGERCQSSDFPTCVWRDGDANGEQYMFKVRDLRVSWSLGNIMLRPPAAHLTKVPPASKTWKKGRRGKKKEDQGVQLPNVYICIAQCFYLCIPE